MTTPEPIAPDAVPPHPEAVPGPEVGLWQRVSDDVEFTRYYATGPDGVRRYIEHDGKLWTAEAIGIKKVAQLTPQEYLTGIVSMDPEAIRALFWSVRRHRMGERNLSITDPSLEVDLTTINAVNVDGQGIAVVAPEQMPPDPQTIAAAQAVIAATFPDLTEDHAHAAGAFIASMLPRPQYPDDGAGDAAGGPAEAGSGEGVAGGEPAPGEVADGPSPTTSN